MGWSAQLVRMEALRVRMMLGVWWNAHLNLCRASFGRVSEIAFALVLILRCHILGSAHRTRLATVQHLGMGLGHFGSKWRPSSRMGMVMWVKV